jgi:putative transposase
MAGLVQMITFRLADALPAEATRSLTADAKDGAGRVRVGALLDAGFGACSLRDPRIGAVVQDALLHFDGQRYRLLAWVIMPNHVHVLLETSAGHPISSIMHAWKPFTANAANRILGRTGRFWQPEYFDRAIRDERHLASAIEYIHQNPVRAGLVDRPENWPFSSAARADPTQGTGRRPALPDGGASP